MELQVTNKSPRPVRPRKFQGDLQKVLKRTISAKPRVIKAARALSPYPRPARTPLAIAIAFLYATPSSAPVSSVWYRRK